jgi:hypothetical protein
MFEQLRVKPDALTASRVLSGGSFTGTIPTRPAR